MDSVSFIILAFIVFIVGLWIGISLGGESKKKNKTIQVWQSEDTREQINSINFLDKNLSELTQRFNVLCDHLKVSVRMDQRIKATPFSENTVGAFLGGASAPGQIQALNSTKRR